MTNEICTDCWRWESFKDGCHFHWKGKSECSQWMQHQLDQGQYKTVIDAKFLF